MSPGGLTIRAVMPSGQSQAPDSLLAFQTYFHIWRFRLPLGSTSASEQLWNHLDESSLPPEKGVHLKRNGLRVGIGVESSWPAVRAVLQELDARVWNQSLVVEHGVSICIELEDSEAFQPIFLYRPDGTLVGRQYPRGRKCLRLDHVMDFDHPGRLRLRFSPELRRSRAPRAWELSQMQAGATVDEVVTFSDLDISLWLRTGDYLIIGPAPASSMPHLVGGVFLNGVERHAHFENVICVVPKIFRRDTTGPPAGEPAAAGREP